MPWTIRLGTSSRLPHEASKVFAGNLANPTTVFSGTVSIPASPADPGPTVAWSTSNTFAVQLQQPFVYTGGTLVIDVLGQTVAGQTTEWWSADCHFEDLQGSVNSLGAGCGPYGGTGGNWSSIDERSLIPGREAMFYANGHPGTFAFLCLGTGGVARRLDLMIAGAAPACNVFLDSIAANALLQFQPPTRPELAARGGEASLAIPLPPTILSLTLTAQWFDLSQIAVSNALQFTTAPTIPALDMAGVAGDISGANGYANVHKAHVWRLTWQ